MNRKEVIGKYLGMMFNSFLWFVMSFLFSMFLLNLATKKFYVIYPLMIGIIVLIVTLLFRVVLLNLLINNLIYSTIMDVFFVTGIFGFFMGVPVLCIIPGILWALFNRTMSNKDNNDCQRQKNQKYIIVISLIVLTLFMIISASIAILDKYTASNIKGMLELNFPVTQEMLYGIIIIGGIFLFLLQYFCEHYIFYCSEKKS